MRERGLFKTLTSELSGRVCVKLPSSQMARLPGREAEAIGDTWQGEAGRGAWKGSGVRSRETGSGRTRLPKPPGGSRQSPSHLQELPLQQREEKAPEQEAEGLRTGIQVLAACFQARSSWTCQPPEDPCCLPGPRERLSDSSHQSPVEGEGGRPPPALDPDAVLTTSFCPQL